MLLKERPRDEPINDVELFMKRRGINPSLQYYTQLISRYATYACDCLQLADSNPLAWHGWLFAMNNDLCADGE